MTEWKRPLLWETLPWDNHGGAVASCDTDDDGAVDEGDGHRPPGMCAAPTLHILKPSSYPLWTQWSCEQSVSQSIPKFKPKLPPSLPFRFWENGKIWWELSKDALTSVLTGSPRSHPFM